LLVSAIEEIWQLAVTTCLQLGTGMAL
jgi:hypothetical protein